MIKEENLCWQCDKCLLVFGIEIEITEQEDCKFCAHCFEEIEITDKIRAIMDQKRRLEEATGYLKRAQEQNESLDVLRKASVLKIGIEKQLKDSYMTLLEALEYKYNEAKKFRESTKQLRKMKIKLNRLITLLRSGKKIFEPGVNAEFIIGVAIRREGIVYQLPQPCRHGDVIFWMLGQGIPGPIFHEQGFITIKGRFVDRVEGAKLALESGQIDKLEYSTEQLFSEDLW